MGKLIGTDPNQVPANASLGTMAFQDYDVVAPLLMGGRRNIFINGDFNIAQRGTSFTSSSGGYKLDRWTSYIGEGTWTVSQDDDVPPGGYSKSMKWLVSTADSTPSTATHVSTRVEGQDLQGAGWGTTGAKPLILSFWVKSNAATRHNVEMDMYHPDDSFEVAIPHYQINEIDTWEFKTIVIPPTSQGFRNTNTSGLLINIFISCGGQFHAPGQTEDPSDYVGFWAPSNTFTNGQRGFGVSGIVKNLNTYVKWAGMQLEVDYSGTGKPTPFEHRSYGEELALCQRYYQQVNYASSDTHNWYASGIVYDGDDAFCLYPSPVQLRALPTVTTSQGNFTLRCGGTTHTNFTMQDVRTTGSSQYTFHFDNSGGLTTGDAAMAMVPTNHYVYIDAEL